MTRIGLDAAREWPDQTVPGRPDFSRARSPGRISLARLKSGLPFDPDPRLFMRGVFLALTFLTLTPGLSQADEAGPRAELTPGPHYVGQAIELRAEGAQKPPKVAGAQVMAAGVGRFRVVPGRSGELTIPPMSTPSGRAGPIRLIVRDLPAAGRPSSFLGGVGDLRVEAEARPGTVRVGQPVEFRVRLTGPGARGSTGRPVLEGKALKDLAIRVEPRPGESVDDPPSRVFGYRLRPGKAGAGTLPTVAVAFFDPKTGRYFTRATAGVPIRVEEAPTLEPAAVRYATAPAGARGWSEWIAVGLGGVGAGAMAYRGLARSARRKALRSGPRRLAARLAGEVRGAGGGIEAARRITEGLADYLAAATGGAVGALTPEEARRGIAGVSGDEGLGESAGRLIGECDRVRYAEGAAVPAGAAAALFEALAGIKPKEAPRAAAG